jgi:arylsulfatase A-like enzyme
LYDDTLIVLTADHGEEFGDHGRWQHGFTLYQEQLHVPLVAKLPASYAAGRRRDDVVSLIDVAPTLLEAAGVDVAEAMKGRSLRPWSNLDDVPMPGRLVFADLAREPKWRAVNAAIRGDSKLILNHTYDLPRPRREFYDLANDPAENRSLVVTGSVVTGLLETRLRQAAAVERYEARTAELNAEDEEKLRALGYLQ